MTRSVALLLTAMLVPVYGRAEIITITPLDCTQVVAHVPAPDVAYKPGVAVDGSAVAPADLPAKGQFKLPDKIVIDITTPIKKIAQTTAGKVDFEAGASLGKLGYDIAAGTMTWNGEPLGDPDAAAIAAACAKQRR